MKYPLYNWKGCRCLVRSISTALPLHHFAYEIRGLERKNIFKVRRKKMTINKNILDVILLQWQDGQVSLYPQYFPTKYLSAIDLSIKTTTQPTF